MMEYQTLVMFDELDKKLIPINEGIFKIAQFSNEKKLNRKYIGNLVLFANGEIKEISQVKITGYYGEKVLTKIFSILNSTYDIEVKLEKSEISIESILGKALEYLKNDLESGDPYMPPQDFSKISDESIKDLKELYSAFTLPAPEDCLDVMV